jgi:hypothetical protein
MKKLILLAGAAVLAATTTPAAAKPGHGNGKSAHAGKSYGKSGHMKRARGKSDRGILVSDRYGRLYALNNNGACPPGLAKKNNGCLPPGQAKKRYDIGQRYNRNFGNRWSYDDIPYYLRSQYDFDPYDRYYYSSGYLYQVDPRTMLIERVISALLR